MSKQLENQKQEGNKMSNRIFYTSVFILCFIPFFCSFGDSNILENPGFERGRDGWFDRTCAIEPVSSPVHSGTGSVKVIDRLQNWQGVKQSVFGKMIDGKTYQVAGWVRLDNAAGDSVKLSFEQQDDAGTRYYTVALGYATDTGWIKLSGEFTLHVTGTLSVLDVYFEGPAPGVDFYVDDAVVHGPEIDAPKVIPAKPKGKGRINADILHQKIEGFGASGAFYTTDLVKHTKKAELFNLLFRDLGLDIFRIRNTYDMNTGVFNESVEIAREGEAVLGRDLKILVSSWSPPAYLKSNNREIGGTLKQNDGKYLYDEFAQWWSNSIAAYNKAGLKIDYISIQNEVNYEAPWPSCIFASSENPGSGLAAYDRAFETVWQRMNAEMGSAMPKMLAPETSSLGDAKDYIANLDNLSHVYGYAVHLYGCSGCGSSPDRFIPRMNSLSNFIKQHGSKSLFQTEFEDEPGTWEDAINTALTVHNSLTAANVSAYLYWDLFWGTGTALISLDDSVSYTIKPTYYGFKQYSAFIDSDWQRVDAVTNNTGLRLSAFISPDNKKLTAVILNVSDSVDISLNLAIKNFTASKGEIYRSSRTENCVFAGNYDENGLLKIPRNSVTTLVLFAKKN
jgi:glucuronoarabinoxylan endo-1,4-beta-xylanase